MVVIDAYSKWLEVIPMTTTTAPKTLDMLREIFARYGLPEQLVSDNGPQFTSTELEMCMKANGIKHLNTVPYHPASNGEAQRSVQTFEHSLKASQKDEGSLSMKLSRFLLAYRNTASSTTGVRPAELLLRHPLRTRLDLLRPSLRNRVLSKQADQKRCHDAHTKFREFEVGQNVLVRNLRGGPKWVPGTVLEQTGPVSYQVQVSDHVWRRHIDQLLEHNTSSPSGVTQDVQTPISELELPQVSSRIPTGMNPNSVTRNPPNDATPPVEPPESSTSTSLREVSPTRASTTRQTVTQH